jgi:hypothetical protein
MFCSLLNLSHFKEASALASQFAPSLKLQQIFDSSASNGTASNGTASNGTASNGTASNGTASNGTVSRANFSPNVVLNTNSTKYSNPSDRNYATPKVSIPAAPGEAVAINNNAPSTLPAHVATKPFLGGMRTTTHTGSNFTSQYPHLNQNNLFQDLPPTADAGPAQVVTAGSTVVLNASNSKASDKIASYSWVQVPTNAKTTLSGVQTPVWEFVAPPVATDTILRFQLTITDSAGQKGIDYVNILDKPGPAINSETNLGKETMLGASKNSFGAGSHSNPVAIPHDASSRSPTVTSTLSPPLTPPLNSAGHR